jgi:hypothetical protein
MVRRQIFKGEILFIVQTKICFIIEPIVTKNMKSERLDRKSDAYLAHNEFNGFDSMPASDKHVFAASQKNVNVAVKPDEKIAIFTPRIPEK